MRIKVQNYNTRALIPIIITLPQTLWLVTRFSIVVIDIGKLKMAKNPQRLPQLRP